MPVKRTTKKVIYPKTPEDGFILGRDSMKAYILKYLNISIKNHPNDMVKRILGAVFEDINNLGEMTLTKKK